MRKKFAKKAAAALSLSILALISLCAIGNQGIQGLMGRGTTEKLPCSVNGTSMTEESLCEGVLSQVLPEMVEERYRKQKEGFPYADAHKEGPSGVLEDMEISAGQEGDTGDFPGVGESTQAAANAKAVLDIADIQKMEAGSVLDMSAIGEDLADALFYSEELDDKVQQRIMGVSYQENDNISLGELRYLRVLHMGFDGQTHIGELLVNASIAADVLEIMEELYKNGYEIEKMVLVDAYGADDELSMEDNNTSSFNYREIAGSSKLSRHSLGLAIDINPLYNPCVKNGGASISPANAGGYADRSQAFAHKIDEGDLCLRLFLEHGFTWGGSWNSLKDYQHFEK